MTKVQRRQRLLVSALSAAVALGSVLVILLQTHVIGPAATTSSAQSVEVVVALTDIQGGDQLGDQNIALRSIPVAQEPDDSTSNVNSVNGRYAISGFVKGAPIILSQVSAQRPLNGSLAVALAPGDVAFSLPFDESRGAGGYIQPNDRIDILTEDGSGATSYLLQDIRVLKVGAASQVTASAIPSVMVVEVTHQQAVVLGFLVNENGGNNITRYVVRARSDENKGSLPGSSAVNSSNVQSLAAQ